MQNTTGTSVEEFDYPPSGLPATSSWREIPSLDENVASTGNTGAPNQANLLPASRQQTDQPPELIAVEAKRSFAAGRAQGVEEGRELERTEQRLRLQEIEKKRIESTARLSEQIAMERDNYLTKVEPEVVKLALSIASRILRHEAQMDPLFLAGAVRVALGQLAETVPVRLRVPAADSMLWSETIAHLPNLKVRPEVIADKEMALGDCALETDMGSVDLGIGSELNEIARGFFADTPSSCVREDMPQQLEASGETR